uniref:Interleukin-20 receptor subunit alpha isoform X2 n=1 Tax=Geotrypetes seraphini TaxID=260995 RepID=A0A6P8QV47_GEOSA|nr:interleukin-20 receptor subunit alpha isoform X2 [Geotrypetes seraphini]
MRSQSHAHPRACGARGNRGRGSGAASSSLHPSSRVRFNSGASTLRKVFETWTLMEQDCTLPKPRDVHFSSINMKNVLHWLPPERLGDGVLYTVKYKIYGTKNYHYKLECKDISKTWCDLSNETYDYEDHYYAKVRATWNYTCSKWAQTDRFFPKIDTKIGPPIVNMYSGERSISVNLTGPVKWKANPMDTASIHDIFSRVQYRVAMFSNKTQQRWHFHIQNNSMDMKKLSPATTYCVTVKTFIPVPYKLSESSELVCANTLEDHTSQLMTKAMFWYSLPVIVGVLLIIAVGCGIYKYIHVSKQKSPQNLVLHRSDGYDGKVFIPQEQVVINFISISVKDNPLSSHRNMNCNLQDDAMQNIDVSPDESNLQKQVQEEASDVKHLGYTSQAQEPAFKMQQDVRLSLQTPQGLQFAPISNNEESILYGLIMRPVGFSPVKEQREQYLKVMPAAKNLLLFNSPNILLNAGIANLEQARWLYLQQMEGSPGLDLNDIQQEASEAGEEEEHKTMVVDWDPRTKQLKIPKFSHFVHDREEDEQACTQRDLNEEEGLLSKLYKRQSSEEPPEDTNDVYLKQFKEQWDLQVQMEE